MKERIKWAFFLLILTGYFTAAQAQADFKKPEYRAQTIYIYNFTKYIQWPEDYNTGDFVIGVVGETGLVQELQKLAQEKTVNGRPIVIKRYASLEQMDRRCSILYLAYDSSNLLSSVLQKTDGSSTLVITQKDGLGRVGSLINFVSVNGKPKFEINVGALEKGKLRCAQQLMTIAIVI
jgi:hypothetical protein